MFVTKDTARNFQPSAANFILGHTWVKTAAGSFCSKGDSMNKKATNDDRPLWLVTVTIKGGKWAVYKDGKRISVYFAKGREAFDHAVAQGWQVGYRGFTYNEGGYLNGIPASR